jgi:hypothetical protein
MGQFIVYHSGLIFLARVGRLCRSAPRGSGPSQSGPCRSGRVVLAHVGHRKSVFATASRIWRTSTKRLGRDSLSTDDVRTICVWQGVAMDSLKFHLGPPCPTLLWPAGGPPLKQPYGHFRGSPPAGWATCSRVLPLWTPHIVRL